MDVANTVIAPDAVSATLLVALEAEPFATVRNACSRSCQSRRVGSKSRTPLRHEQAIDAARILAALDDEPGPLAGAAASILLFGAGHVHNSANLGFAPLQRHQRPEQPGRVEPVRFRAAGTAVGPDLEANYDNLLSPLQCEQIYGHALGKGHARTEWSDSAPVQLACASNMGE